MKRHSPAAARNAAPIAEVLEKELPQSGLVLEIASGSGEHAVFMANRFPDLDWQPSDLEPEALASVEAWREDAGIANLRSPLTLDAARSDWPIEQAAAIVCINMIHISPWEAVVGLFRNASLILAPEAPLITYGPYFEEGVEPAPSNLEFDASLRERNPGWGLRHVSTVDELAGEWGFARTNRYQMPANNLMLVYRRT